MPIHRGAVGWSGNIDPRHQRRIAAAAAIGVGCEKEGGVDQVFPYEKMRKERIEGWKQGTMEFMEIKSKKEHE